MSPAARPLVWALTVVFAACATTPGNDVNQRVDLSSCTAANTTPLALAVGDFRTIDVARQGNCISLPGSGAAQQYVVVAYSGNGASTGQGTSASYTFQSIVGSSTASAAFAGFAARQSIGAGYPSTNAARFEQTLRSAERVVAADPSLRRGSVSLPPAAPPAVGDRDSFYVCANATCSSFNRVGATVKYSGAPGVIYLDDHQNAGAEQFTDPDLQQLGQLFDDFLYAADTTAFGRESDINNDQHISILVTPAVNGLTPDCTNGRIIGYSFSNDLIPFARGSNGREMFYTFTTSIATPKCKAVSRATALVALPPTLIHELQHMISFNQHVLLRGGVDQDTWMNEGLSHFAEELGWRTIPPARCASAPGGDCFSQFMGGDVSNAFAYLNDTEGQYLVAPEVTDGTLPERGAAWLFVRWIADHFSSDTLLGTQLTRALEMNGVVGAIGVAQVTGADFPTLVGQWQLANWTDNLPGFPQTGLLNYRTWNFRSLFAGNYPGVFSKIYPLTPDSTTGNYSHPGVLRAGSGRMVRYQLPAGSPSVTIRVAADVTGGVLGALIAPGLAIVRVQ